MDQLTGQITGSLITTPTSVENVNTISGNFVVTMPDNCGKQSNNTYPICITQNILSAIKDAGDDGVLIGELFEIFGGSKNGRIAGTVQNLVNTEQVISVINDGDEHSFSKFRYIYNSKWKPRKHGRGNGVRLDKILNRLKQYGYDGATSGQLYQDFIDDDSINRALLSSTLSYLHNKNEIHRRPNDDRLVTGRWVYYPNPEKYPQSSSLEPKAPKFEERIESLTQIKAMTGWSETKINRVATTLLWSMLTVTRNSNKKT